MLRVFNLQYGIGALRKRRAGHDPDRLALPDRLGWKCPGRDVLDDLQDSRRGDGMNLPDIVMPDGKPIHRGIVPGWIVALGDNVFSQNAAQGIQQVDLLHAQDRDGVQDHLKGIF